MKCYPKHIINLRMEIISMVIHFFFRGRLIKGNKVLKFENKFAQYIGCRFAIGVAQARLALIVILKSMGFNKGDEIILSSYNFHIIPECLIKLGIVPVFVDIEADTFNINAGLIERKITDRTKAIIVTHMFGLPADIDGILEIAKKHKLKVIEDCAHALGSEYKGKKAGSFTDASFFSFGPGKNMPCFGGGMIAVNDESLFGSIKEHIDNSSYPPFKAIINNILKFTIMYSIFTTPLFTYFTFPLIYLFDIFNIDILEFEKKEFISDRTISEFYKQPLKLTNIQAAVGLIQLQKLDLFNTKRHTYSEIISREVKKSCFIRFPKIFKERISIYLYFIVSVKDKEYFRKKLLKKRIYLSKDTGMSDCSTLSEFKNFKAECINATLCKDNVIEIPNNHFLNNDDILYISKSIKEVIYSYDQ